MQLCTKPHVSCSSSSRLELSTAGSSSVLPCLQDEQQFAIGQGVDEALHLMAEGGTLPPDPAMQGRVPESADSFRARMRQLTTRYESQFLRRKDWEVGP